MKKFIVLLVLCLAAPATANANTAKINELFNQVHNSRSLEVVEELRQIPPKERRQYICLALNIYHEARGSTARDQTAVGHVTLNRVGRESFDDTVCQVVWASGQFSWTRRPIRTLIPKEPEAWVKSQHVAYELMRGSRSDPTGGATYFYDPKRVAKPQWAKKGRSKRIDSHVYVVVAER